MKQPAITLRSSRFLATCRINFAAQITFGRPEQAPAGIHQAIASAYAWLPGSARNAKSRSSKIGPINLGVKQTGERRAGNPRSAFEVAEGQSGTLCPLASMSWKWPDIGSRVSREVHARPGGESPPGTALFVSDAPGRRTLTIEPDAFRLLASAYTPVYAVRRNR